MSVAHTDQLKHARALAGTRTIALSQGLTAYDVQGEQGPWIVLLHGIFTPMLTWDRLAPLLARAGFRVLRYDAYGTGLSDRPSVDYDHGLYVRQLRELLDALEIQQTTLVGWSLGGATSVRFASQEPQRVRALALIAPALLTPNPGLFAGVFHVPGFAALLERSTGLLINFAARSQLDQPKAHAAYVAGMHAQQRHPGAGSSLASALAHFPWGYGKNLPTAVARIPTLLIWGRKDPTVPFARAKQVAKLFDKVEWCVLERGRHAPHVDQAEQVAAALATFCRATRGA